MSSPDTPWQPSQEDADLRASLHGELVVSGIYIRLFVANPGWVLRKPREFLIELMENVLKQMGQVNKKKPDDQADITKRVSSKEAFYQT